MSRVYTKAVIVTALAAMLITFGFLKWKENTFKSEGVTKIQAMDKMETEGLPNFVSTTFGGQRFELHQLKDSVIILNFWASWCGPCVEEFPSMVKLIKEMGLQVQMVAVSQDDSLKDAEAFLKAFPEAKDLQNLHLIFDPDRSIGKQFGIDRLPETLIANKKFKLTKKIIGSLDWASKDAIAYMKSLAEE